MNRRHLKFFLRSGAAVFSLSSLALVSWANSQPLETFGDAAPTARSQGRGESHLKEKPLPSRDALKEVSGRNYRRPLYDPPPPLATPKPKKKVQPLPKVALLGTIASPSYARAMVEGKRGKVELKKIGDEVGNSQSSAKIVAIEIDYIEIEHLGKRHRVDVEERRR